MQYIQDTLLHDLRHLNGRDPHEIVQIGDDAADEIIRLRRQRRVATGKHLHAVPDLPVLPLVA